MIRNIPAIILALLAVDFLLVVAYAINFTVGQPIGPLNTLLDLDGESNLPTWYSSIQLFAVSFSFGLLTITEKSYVVSKIFAALALIFLGMSADEIIQIHEYLGARLDFFLPGEDRNNSVFSVTGIWMFVIGIPATGVVLSLLWCAWLHLRMAPAAFSKCLMGLFIFAVGAVGVETLSNFVVGTAHAVEIVTEEFMEMLGVTILLWGCFELLQAHGVRSESRR